MEGKCIQNRSWSRQRWNTTPRLQHGLQTWPPRTTAPEMEERAVLKQITVELQPAEESLTTPSTLSEKVDNSDTVEFGPAGTKSL